MDHFPPVELSSQTYHLCLPTPRSAFSAGALARLDYARVVVYRIN